MKKNQDLLVAKPQTVAAMTRVIGLLREKECTTNDVAALLGYSKSGARRYIRDLDLAGVLKRHQRKGSHFDLLRMIDDEGRVTAFERQLETLTPTEQQVTRAERRRQKFPELLPGTHIHLANDDDEVPLRRVCNTPVTVVRDPLVAALFGAPPDCAMVFDVVMREVAA